MITVLRQCAYLGFCGLKKLINNKINKLLHCFSSFVGVSGFSFVYLIEASDPAT